MEKYEIKIYTLSGFSLTEKNYKTFTVDKKYNCTWNVYTVYSIDDLCSAVFEIYKNNKYIHDLTFVDLTRYANRNVYNYTFNLDDLSTIAKLKLYQEDGFDSVDLISYETVTNINTYHLYNNLF